jgi:hypothetical protein
VISRKAWKFIANGRSIFKFYNHVKVSHQEASWQTLISWNYLKSDCEISIGVNVKYNFIKIGIIANVGDIESCRDYSKSEKAAIYCFSSGQFHKFKEDSNQTSFKKHHIAKVNLKIVNNMITWEVKDKNNTTEAISSQFTQEEIEKSRIIIIFRKGSLEMFPQNE